MGNWKLEIFRAVLYVMFPVGAFYYFNTPEYFEKSVIKQRQKIFPPDNPVDREKILEMAKQFQEKQEIERIKAMEEALKAKN